MAGTAENWQSVIEPLALRHSVIAPDFPGHGHSAPGGGDYSLTTWNVTHTDAGNLTLSPTSQPVTKGHAFSLTGTYSGLSGSKVYFGQITNTLGSQSATTFVTVRP